MLRYVSLLTALLLPTLAWPAPAPAAVHRRQENEAASATPVPPPGSTGSLRGSNSLGGYSSSNPLTSEEIQIPPSDFELGPGQDANADLGFYLDLSDVENPQPIRGTGDGPTDPGPRNPEFDRQNANLFAPPGTDSGDVPNAKWPLELSHNRHDLGSAGWARQQNVDVLPIATAMAGVDMRLPPHAYRELHWHKANEWSLILNGTVRISAVDEAGRTFVDDLQAGDVSQSGRYKEGSSTGHLQVVSVI